ncbi:hypothetical protein M9Y10_020745 [Tritrichomonas musculus]|uniref:Protein kinase domain-containing protein n=1 Tax=Tritrichomonas musculus TaxID=1915356 RepID=A0ABR2HGS1_9EUKA
MQNQNCSFNIDNYDIREKLRSRTLEYKKVIAVDRRTNKEVDIITYKQEQDDREMVFINIRRGLVYNNVYISQFLNLPGIVKLIEYRLPLAKEDPNLEKKGVNFSGFVAVFEHMKYSDLSINLPRSLPTQEINSTVISKMIFGIAAIMKQIHYHNICLQNLSLDSICLDDNLEPHITNFGSAHFVFTEDDINKEPSQYFPEEYCFSRSKFAKDIYSFGSLILKMFVPRRGQSNFQFIRILEGASLPSSIPDAYSELIRKCTDKKIEQLPSFVEITKLLRDDKYVFDRSTDLEALHEYQNRIDDQKITDIETEIYDYHESRLMYT